LTKLLLIIVICLVLSACGAKGDLYLPVDKPLEQEKPADLETKPEQQNEPFDS